VSPRGALAELSRLHPLGIRPGLERIRALLAALGHPERGMRYVHVAGTNGKGSVCRILESCLIEAGHPVGMFISPHLVDFRERFRIQGRMAPAALVEDSWPALRAALQDPKVLRHGQPTFFEAVTALAFLIFKASGRDLVILETGLGGRFDSTNVIAKPLLTLITNISLEHTQILGTTESKIAWEKAGIVKRGAPLVTGATGAALKVIRAVARERGARPVVSLAEGKGWKLLKAREALDPEPGQSLEIEIGGVRRWLFLPLLGRHQRANLALALAGLEILRGRGLAIPEAALVRGVARADWPGRLQLIRRNPTVLVDGAHNPAGAKALARALRDLKPRRVLLAAGVLKDKDWKGMFKILGPLASRLHLARPDDARALDPEILAHWLSSSRRMSKSKIRVHTGPAKALKAAMAEAKPGDLVVAAGSLYTVGEILSKFP
jgi:dihydrofolate synthase/folylpolyglutamate synthase